MKILNLDAIPKVWTNRNTGGNGVAQCANGKWYFIYENKVYGKNDGINGYCSIGWARRAAKKEGIR